VPEDWQAVPGTLEDEMNKHADLIRKYAEDWAETEKPWKRWECDAG
jgi:hypothetical protein